MPQSEPQEKVVGGLPLWVVLGFTLMRRWSRQGEKSERVHRDAPGVPGVGTKLL